MDFAAFGITPESMAYAYVWGFGTVVSAFLLGYTGAVLKRAIGMI